MVKVTANGKHVIRRVQIDPSVMDDREMLEDLLVTALADVHQQAEAAAESRMSGATSGMPMPPGFKLPF
jgi:DNA-binding YbaB/EbfC family protein